MNGTSKWNVMKLYDRFFNFWRDTLGSVANGTVAVASMEILFENKGEKFHSISKIYHQYSNTSEPQSVKNTQEKFYQYQDYIELLRSFDRHFMFNNEHRDENLQILANEVATLDERWSDVNFKVSDLFKIDLNRFDSIRQSLEILYQYKQSNIAIHLWTDIFESIQEKLSMQRLNEMNTFEVSVWLRNEQRKKFILDENRDFSCEEVIHWIFDAEIDGLKLGV